MKKNIITLIVLLLVLGGALTAFLLLRNDPAPAEEVSSTADTTYVLGGIPAPFVKQITVRNELDTFTVLNKHQNAIQQQNADAAAPGYSVDGMQEADLNQALLKSVMTGCGSLSAQKQLPASTELSAYGLDAPRATVEVTYEDGAKTLEIGANAPGDEGTYVKQGDALYLVSVNSVSNFMLSRFDFVSKTLTGGTAEQAAFNKITLSGGKFTEPVEILKSTETSQASSVMGLGSYYISTPIKSGVDLDKGITPLSSLLGLVANKVVASGDDNDSAALAPYGLAPAYMTVAVEAEDPAVGSFTLSVSEADADGIVHLRLSGKPYIYQVPAGSLPWMSLDLFTLREKMLILPFIDSVSSVDVMANGQTHTFGLTGEGDTLVVTLDGKELSADYFRKFYQTLLAASYDSEVTADDSGDASQDSSPSMHESADTPVASTDAIKQLPDDSAATLAASSSEDAPATVDSERELSAVTQPPLTRPDLSAQPTDAPMMTFTYNYRDGTAASVVKFWSATARKYYIALDDGPIYYVKSLYVDRVLEDLPKIIAGQEVKSYY